MGGITMKGRLYRDELIEKRNEKRTMARLLSGRSGCWGLDGGHDNRRHRRWS